MKAIEIYTDMVSIHMVLLDLLVAYHEQVWQLAKAKLPTLSLQAEDY
jgi:hypothetical protein